MYICCVLSPRGLFVGFKSRFWSSFRRNSTRFVSKICNTNAFNHMRVRDVTLDWPNKNTFDISKMGSKGLSQERCVLLQNTINHSNSVSYTHLTLPTNREV